MITDPLTPTFLLTCRALTQLFSRVTFFLENSLH